jgi:hypothetical protein
MSQPTVPVNRFLVGLIAVACLAAWGGIWLFAPDGRAIDSQTAMLAGAFGRVGLLMAAFWIALPTRERGAAWANLSLGQVGAFALAVFAVVRWPRTTIPLLLFVAAIGWLLRPRNRPRPPRRFRDSQSDRTA